MDRITKTEATLKQTVRVQQQNIARLYSICSALYQEIQELKHHVNYKAPDSLGSEVESSQSFQTILEQQQQQQEYVAEMPSITTSKGRSKKIINN